MPGKRFGRLTVQSIERNKSRWWARMTCDCGNSQFSDAKSVIYGEVKSCGCLFSETLSNRRILDEGTLKCPMYFRWRNLLNRCYWRKGKSFKDYGGRGIDVCDRWRFGEAGIHPFQCFLDDMGECPNGMSIDRINNDLGYSKSNCTWSTIEQQIRNRRNTVLVDINGEKMTLREYCLIVGLNHRTLSNKMSKLRISANEVIRTYDHKLKQST
jgi:hypothetical protein